MKKNTLFSWYFTEIIILVFLSCNDKIKENKQDIIYNKNVLIFDDIYTTGATANECAKAIREANPSKVGILTIAKD